MSVADDIVIHTRDLKKHYVMGTETVRALRGVDVDIRRNEYIAIMGPSGSGKSTLMNLIGCLDTPTSGEYILNGQPVQDLDDDDLARIRDLAQRYAAALGTIAEVEREPDLSEEPGLLSFQIAALVDWDQPTKHRFLAIRSAFERITRLLQTLPKLVAEIERRAEVHQRAPTNGKGPSGP